MSRDLNQICPIPDDLLTPAETDPQANVTWRTPGTLKVGDIPPRDYPEQIDEDAAGAMEAERDALQARVTELENEKANLLRDVAYLNGKLDTARGDAFELAAQVVEKAKTYYPVTVFPESPRGEHGETIDACSARAIRYFCDAIAQTIRSHAQEAKP